MKKPKNIKSTIIRAALYLRTLTHVRYYRGFGVHSPFVYGIIRNAIMKREPQGDRSSLYDELRKRGFSKRRAAQLHNLYEFQGLTSVTFVEVDGHIPSMDAGTLCLAMPEFPESNMTALAEQAREVGCTLCVVSPRESCDRSRMSRRLVDSHRHTSIDNRGFLLLFFNDRMPKQHFKL